MAHFLHMTVTMNTMPVQIKIYNPLQQTKQGPRGGITVGITGENITMGVKPDQPRKLAIRKRPTIIRDWVEPKRGANDG